MRKALKIKTSILVLAWFIIFLHGVVPHLHAHHSESDIQSSSCSQGNVCSHIHSQPSEVSDLAYISAAGHKHNETICHFNPDLFSQIDLDSSFVNEIAIEAKTILRGIELQNPEAESKCNKPPLLSNISLRAPPVS